METFSDFPARAMPVLPASGVCRRSGTDLDRSTLADWVGKATALLEPLADAIGRHVLGGQAIFADDTPIKLQAPGTGRTRTARIWAYVRDERPWLGPDPPAACYRFTCDRKGEPPANHLLATKTGCMASIRRPGSPARDRGWSRRRSATCNRLAFVRSRTTTNRGA